MGARAKHEKAQAAPAGNAAWAERGDVFGPGNVKYPPFKPSMEGPEFAAAFSNLESGQRLPEHPVRLAGRITSKREASKKLFFYDLECGGQRIQVMSPVQQYDLPEGQGVEAFRDLHLHLRRGDVIGVSGFPGKSNVGELSVIPRHITLLSPCLNPLPEELKDVGPRFRQRHVDLLVNRGNRKHLEARAQVHAEPYTCS